MFGDNSEIIKGLQEIIDLLERKLELRQNGILTSRGYVTVEEINSGSRQAQIVQFPVKAMKKAKRRTRKAQVERSQE